MRKSPSSPRVRSELPFAASSRGFRFVIYLSQVLPLAYAPTIFNQFPKIQTQPHLSGELSKYTRR